MSEALLSQVYAWWSRCFGGYDRRCPAPLAPAWAFLVLSWFARVLFLRQLFVERGAVSHAQQQEHLPPRDRTWRTSETARPVRGRDYAYPLDARPQKVKSVHQRIAATRGIAYTTVMTTMGHLVKKGMLVRGKEQGMGGAYTYTAAIGEQEFVAQRLADILSAVERDYPAALAQYLDMRLPA